MIWVLNTCTQGENLNIKLFFKNSEELRFVTIENSPSRYSYDVTGRNKEVNQFNGKSSTNLREESASRLGASVVNRRIEKRTKTPTTFLS
jgi:hypothetical protein